MSAVLQLKAVQKSYTQGHKKIDILNGVDLTLEKRSITALVGKSGAGKSTLLQISGLLDDYDSGEILFTGQSILNLSIDKKAELRSKKIGFVYQAHHLMADFTALENTMMPLLIQGTALTDAQDKGRIMLERLGLADRTGHRPSQLSGGEQQRVAIARALAHSPDILLADEPTGNLDEATSDRVFSLLLELIKEDGIAALIATHDRKMAANMDHMLELSHGNLSAI